MAQAAAARSQPGGAPSGSSGGSRAFARSEWIHMLIRIGIARYILDGDEVPWQLPNTRICRRPHPTLPSTLIIA